MKVLYCASECVPFVKTGGLADVAGALPAALRREGTDIRVMLPKYGMIDEYWKRRMEHVCHFDVLFGWEKIYCGVERIVDNGVTYYFIDNEAFFYVNDIYGDGISEWFCNDCGNHVDDIDDGCDECERCDCDCWYCDCECDDCYDDEGDDMD